MPEKVQVYDKGNPSADPPEKPRVIEMWTIDAEEAVANGGGRYSRTKPAGWGAAPPPRRPVGRPPHQAAPASSAAAAPAEPNKIT